MQPKLRNAEAVLAHLGTRTKGVVTRAELLAAGLTQAEIAHRLRAGSLIHDYRGVYRVGHRAPSVEADYLAAVKACGDRAVLSGEAAGWLWGILKGKPPSPEVSAPMERRVKGLRTRRRRLLRSEATVHRGIPITTVPLTLVDLAASLSPADLARACHEAGVRYRTTPRAVASALERRPNAKGAARMWRILTGDEHVVLSSLESRFLELLREQRLPLPNTNRPAGGRRVDCRWPAKRLTVELDSYRFHNSRLSWEADRRREREAYARGDEFRRYTWADVFEGSRLMLGELRALLNP